RLQAGQAALRFPHDGVLPFPAGRRDARRVHRQQGAWRIGRPQPDAAPHARSGSAELEFMQRGRRRRHQPEEVVALGRIYGAEHRRETRLGNDSEAVGETKMKQAAKTVALSLLRAYKWALSPMLPPACRYVPTCSEYAMEAIDRFGVVRGSYLAMARVLRCHPFVKGGYDPVPHEISEPKSEFISQSLRG